MRLLGLLQIASVLLVTFGNGALAKPTFAFNDVVSRAEQLARILFENSRGQVPQRLRDRDQMYTLLVALANLIGEHVQDTELMMAGAMRTVIRVVLVFTALQRYYIAGILSGSLKE